MYEEEMKDLERTYEGAIEDMSEELEKCVPGLLDSMERFVKLMRGVANVRGRLTVLRAKMGIEAAGDALAQEECDGE